MTAGKDLLVMQEQMRTGASPYSREPTVQVRDTEIGATRCVVCEPPGATSITVYFHGGGYRLGSASWSTPFATKLAAAGRSTIVVADYRLAPENPFPAGLHDATEVYSHLLAPGELPVVAAGDSAGGGLAAALVVAAAQSGIALPAGLVLMSPWLDLTCAADTYRTRAETDELFSLDSAKQASELYLQGHDPTDPLVSPALARLDAWPPTMVLTSTEEVLLEDSARFVSGLALTGTHVTAMFEPGRSHAWPAVVPDRPEADSALEAIGAFYARLFS